jgi:hypothetical protein
LKTGKIKKRKRQRQREERRKEKRRERGMKRESTCAWHAFLSSL